MALSPNLLQPFLWGRGGAAMTPEQVAREREIAEALVAQGIDTSPVGDWTQGAARMANVLAGKIREGRASKAETEGRSAFSDRLGSILGGGSLAAPDFGGSPSTSTAMATLPATDTASARVAQAHGDGSMTAYQNAIASIESAGSGDYAAIGPRHKTLGRALGRYQVMEANIGPWSEKHLGKRITPEEFLQTPQYQDAIFNGEFGSYVNKYGPEGAAQAWFGGEGGVGKVNRKDSLGTTIGAYTDKFRSALGGTPPAVAANESMSTGGLSNGLTPEMLQQWAAQNYAPEQAAGVTVAETPEEIAAAEMAMADPAFAASMAPPLPQPTMVQDRPIADVAQALTGFNVNPDIPMAGGASGFAPVGTQAPNVTLPANAQFSLPPPQQQIAQSLAQSGGGGQPSMQQLMEIASDPWATDAQRQVVGALIKQQMEQSDPYRRAQLEKLQLETEALRNPAAPKLINAGDGRLYDPASREWITAPDMGTPKPTEAEARIGRLTENLMATGDFIDPMEAQNIATGIVDGRLRADRHPVTGVLQVVDMATGRPAYQQGGSQTGATAPMMQPEVTADPNQFGQQYPNAPGSFGVEGAAQGAVNRVTDALGMGPAYPDVAQTQADFAVLRESLLNDIASSYGRQPPSWLLKEIRDLTPEAGSAFQGAAGAQSKLNALGRHLVSELENTNRALQRELSPTNRQEMEARQQGLIAGIERVNGALQSFGGQDQQQGAPQPGSVEDGYRFKGGDPADPNNWEPVN